MSFQLDVRSDFTFIRIKLAGAVCCVVLWRAKLASTEQNVRLVRGSAVAGLVRLSLRHARAEPCQSACALLTIRVPLQ